MRPAIFTLHSALCTFPFSLFTSLEISMDQIETYIADLIIKALHKSAPAMTAEDDAKVTKTVTDFVTAGMDLVAIYFAVRSAKK